MIDRHLLIVGCGFPQLSLIRAAKNLGYQVTGADMNPHAVGVPLVDHFLDASTGDPDAIVAAFKRSGATGIATTGSELALTTTASVAAQLSLPFYADPQTVYRCQAKDAMRAAYRAASLRTPRFAACDSTSQARSFVERVGLPVVAKPAHGWGQRGVSLVSDVTALDAAVQAAIQASHGGGGAVVEEKIEGHEVSVNGWVVDGNLQVYCVTDREVFPGDRPLGVMRSEVSPCSLPANKVQLAVKAASDAAHALGLVRGPCYSQVAVGEQEAVVFETAARLGGGFDADVTKLASGVDMYQRLLGVAFNDHALEHSGTPRALTPAMVRFLRPKPGRLLRVDGLEQVRQMDGVVDAGVYPTPGDEIPPLINASKRVGHILLEANTRDELVAKADEAEAAVRLVLEG